jgi:arylamine N-acetyltransferase
LNLGEVVRTGTESSAAGAFFDHFGVDPGVDPAELLHAFAAAFSAIPWENLTKLLSRDEYGAPMPRMPGTVILEHLSKGTGGTCFSLTEAAREILASTGMRVRPLLADMQHGPSIHCALLAELPGGAARLVDPGYLVPVPVELLPSADTEVPCGPETLVYRPAGDERSWDMYTRDDSGTTLWRYRLKLDRVDRGEFMKAWTDSFDSPGMNSLHVSRRTDVARFYAHNTNLRITDRGGRRNEKLREGYAPRISELFGISSAVADEAWKRLKGQGCR